MPHIVVKLYAGKTDAQKSELTRKLVDVFMNTLGSSEASLSVGIEEYDPPKLTNPKQVTQNTSFFSILLQTQVIARVYFLCLFQVWIKGDDCMEGHLA